MRKKVVAQYNEATPIASNPANGISNIPLALDPSGEAVPSQQIQPQDNEAAGGIDPEEFKTFLRNISVSAPQDANKYTEQINTYMQNSTNPTVQSKLRAMLGAISNNASARTLTRDPLTNKTDPTAPEIAQKLLKEVENMTDNTTNSTASSLTFNFYKEAAKKKKTRGNPFRVLMGQVGKLLDHGMEKKDIVRYLEKNGTFNKETIERCVDVVRDYNRKLHKEDQFKDKMEPETKEDIDKRLSSVSTHKENSMSLQNDPKIASYNFAKRQAAKKDDGEKNGLYDVKPDFAKRSTAELMARATWLNDLIGFTGESHSEGRKAADVTGARAELKEIKAALQDRGYDEQEIEFK